MDDAEEINRITSAALLDVPVMPRSTDVTVTDSSSSDSISGDACALESSLQPPSAEHTAAANALVESPVPPPPRSAPDTSSGGGGILGSYAPLLLSRSASAGAATSALSMPPGHGSMLAHSNSSHQLISSSVNHGSSELVHQLQRLCSRQRQRSEERQFVRDVERVLALLRQQTHAAHVYAQRSRANTLAAGTDSSGSAAVGADRASGESAAAHSMDTRPHSMSLSSSAATAHHHSYQQQQQQPAPVLHARGALSSAEIELLVDCIAGLFEHRNYEVRAVAFETVTLCLSHYGEQLSSALRRKVFALLADHPAGDYALRQKALRALTHDGRNVEPFHAELAWLLLRLLDDSDEQRDLVALIQGILRRSPLSLELEPVIAITHVLCSRGDAAWNRGDIESCRKLLGFFHTLATHGLEIAASTPTSLRTLCCLVNADGHGTWSIMKHLLNGAAGYQVLRGLVHLLENPLGSNQWVLRGAVFFVGMSCWGSQRVGKLEDIKWAPVLLAMERVLACNNGVVIFEVILALQRLIKKFGAKSELEPSKPAGASASGGCGTGTGSGGSDKRLIVEWDIILRMFRELRPWLSLAEDLDSDDGEGYSSVPSMMTHPQMPAPPPSTMPSSTSASGASQPHAFTEQQFSVSIHQTRIPRELLDTLSVVEDLVAQSKFAGDIEDFFDVLEDYLPHLNEGATLFLLRHRAESSHPAYHVQWLRNLSDAMLSFFTNASMLGAVRLEALEVLRVNLHFSRNICEDRVIEDVLLPTLSHVFDDHHAEVRRHGLDLVTEVARQLESAKCFDALLDILANAVTLALYDDSQVYAASGIVSLFSSCFNHLPHSRTLRMYELIAKIVETHRNADVRRIALACLMCVCEADVDFRLQWRDTQVRTSRFLYVARRAVRNPQTGACVPVARGLRAMLTLVSTETHAELFRMAVAGIRAMLENRVVLTDVDISDVTLKIISSIDYRAFGRAAIPDELARLAEDSDRDSDSNHATATGGESVHDARLASTSSSSNSAWGELTARPNTEPDVLRYMNTTAAPLLLSRSGRHGDPALCKSSVRDTLVVLCKTRFMTLGLELLALITSYTRELTGTARHHLIACLVGALSMQLAVADKDLFSSSVSPSPLASASSSELLPKARSSIDLVHSDRYDRSGASNHAMEIQQQQQQRRSGDRVDSESSSQQQRRHSAAKPASPPHFGFTSRMLSRFQASSSSSSHGNLFHHVLSSSSSSSATTKPSAAADADARAQLQRTLQALYNAEFAMLHVCTNVLSLLAVRMPDDVAADVELVLRSARLCFTTPDGDFRADGYGAALEMVVNIVQTLPRLRAQHYEDVLELALIGLDYASSKQLSYLAFRLLCHVVLKCAPADRIALASVALPRLQQCHTRIHSLLLEAAIDFLMTFAYSRSFPPPPARCTGVTTTAVTMTASAATSDHSEHASSGSDHDDAVVQSRSWVYRNSILTIDVTARGSAKLLMRRANCTNHWDLQLVRDCVLDPSAVLPTLASLDIEADDAVNRDTSGRASAADQIRSADADGAVADGSEQSASALNDSSANSAATESTSGESVADGAITVTTTTRPESFVAEETTLDESISQYAPTGGASRAPATTDAIAPAALSLPPPVPVSQDATGAAEHAARKKWSSSRKQVSFALAGSSPTMFPHPSAALPPLPAYDGIGGSPSYFCEAHPVRRRNDLRVRSAAARSARDSASAADGSTSPFTSSLYDDESDGPDDFSLDGSSLQPLSERVDRVCRSERARRGAQTTTTTAGSSTSEQERAGATTRPDSATPTGTLDPMFLMMQLFDLTAENRPQLLANGAALSLGLSVLDRTPEYETHKIGLLYVRSPKQRAEADILANTGGSVRYLKFLRGLGTFTKLQGLPGYSGGLDTANDSDGKFGLVYKDDYTQILFHVATMMGPESTRSASDGDGSSTSNTVDRSVAMGKKRHIGNDFVHVVYKECDAEYNVATFSGQFNDVHIVVQPLNDREYRTHVHAKAGIKPFGPLHGTQVISSAAIAECVRLTCLNANLACQTFHQDLIGFALNCEERLKQIKQLGMRLASGNDWMLDVQ